MAGLLDIFGGGSGSADDPYADILTPAQRNHMQAQGLLAMAGAFAEAGMPSRFPIPFGSALGKAAAALGTGQEAGMTAALANAYKAQQVRDLRSKAALQAQLNPIFTEYLARLRKWKETPAGAPPTPPPGLPAAPSAGAGAGPGAPTEGDVEPLLPANLSLPSDTTPDFFTRGLAPKASGGGLLNYPEATGGLGVGGGGLLSPARETFDTATPSSRYAPGGSLYPFKDLGVVPGAGGGGAAASAPAGGPQSALSQDAAEAEVARLDAEYAAKNPNASPAAKASMHVQNVIVANRPADNSNGAPTPVPEVTSVPGPTNGIDPRRRAALDAILGGIQTAQAGPSAQRLAQFAGPGAADAPAPTGDTIPDGGGLLGVAPDLRAPIEANPLARVNAVLAQIRQRESGGNYAIPPEQNVDFPRSHASGGYQFQPGTWREWTAKSGFGREYPEAYLAPSPVQDAVARYAALHGDVNAPNLWGASAGNRPYPSPYGEGGGPLPPDEMIPSGPDAGDRPPVTQAQYRPQGAAPGGPAVPGMPQLAAPSTLPQLAPPGAAPALGAGGKIPGLGVSPQELAVIDAMAESAGLGNPFKGLLDTYYKSPGYLEESAGATARGRIAQEEPSKLRTDAAKARLDLIQQLAKDGLTLDKNDNPVEIPGMRDMLGRTAGEIERAKEQAKSQFALTDAQVLGPDGKTITTQKIPLYEYIYRQQQQAAKAAMGARPQPGDIVGTPYKSPSDLKLEESDIKLLDQKRALADTARTTIQNANDLRQAIEQGVIAGAGADTRTQMLKLGQLLGITGTDTNQLIANTEKYIASQGKNLKEGLAGLGPPISKSDTDIAERISGGQMTTPQGMLEILRIREKYHRQAIVDYNQMASRVPVSPIIGDRTVKEPPTYGAQIIEGPGGERMWNKDGKWVPF